ncbi:hypothetical protein TNCV_1629361 [Trichonephila clavipes]|uniref:Uncharacterized protein n=1 Tax=Trichonephila clavipes TaxID=2585209 RepID=A0A8X7BH48_TRICX|nr:hypothetical protein TNCV_1629361 [Trichonephila clavipes]
MDENGFQFPPNENTPAIVFEAKPGLIRIALHRSRGHLRSRVDFDTNHPELAARENLSSSRVTVLFLRVHNNNYRSSTFVAERCRPWPSLPDAESVVRKIAKVYESQKASHSASHLATSIRLCPAYSLPIARHRNL